MSKTTSKRTNETTYTRQFTESEVKEVLCKIVVEEGGARSVSRTRLYVEDKDCSTGPYKVYNVIVVESHGSDDKSENDE